MKRLLAPERNVSLLIIGLLCAGSWTSPAASSIDLARQINQVFIDVAEKASPAVVVVSVAHKANYVNPEEEDNPFFQLLPPNVRRQLEEQREKLRKEQENQPRFHHEPFFDGQGSGVVIRKEGYILTNRHVVEGSRTLSVTFMDGRELPATIVKISDTTDLALVKVAATGLPAATIGDSNAIQVGQTAIAIGSPLGTFTETVTRGVVSGLDREITVTDESTRRASTLKGLIQTDAAINPGNSGGPLLDAAGQVIGLNTAVATSAEGLGFAIPIAAAKDLIGLATGSAA